MTPGLLRAVAATVLLTATGQASAVDCHHDRFDPVGVMADLPPAIRAVVEQRGPVADRGERWQDTDVVIEKGLRSRRLAMAAIGSRHAFVVIEWGGGPVIAQQWSFERVAGEWRTGEWQGERYVDPAVPESLAEMLFAICDGYPRPPPRLAEAITGVVTSNGSVVLTVTDAAGAIAYKLDRDPRWRGTPRYERITTLRDGKPLSPAARAALRVQLAALVDAMPVGNAGRALAQQTLKALVAGAATRGQ